MGYQIEILPQKELPENWKNLINIKFSSPEIPIVFNSKIPNYYIVNLHEDTFIHIWLSIKEREIFKDSEYLEAIKNIDTINMTDFLKKFDKLSYTIILEYKGTENANHIIILLKLTSIIAELSDGIITFRNDIRNFKVDNIYFPTDLDNLIY
ncbi:MAG: hypothetical protein MUC87_00980 [Bacteroidia bacterium]|jgi:hypothetical protein|nr:hypothetical protein [Bacteroidia bacterium]